MTEEPTPQAENDQPEFEPKYDLAVDETIEGWRIQCVIPAITTAERFDAWYRTRQAQGEHLPSDPTNLQLAMYMGYNDSMLMQDLAITKPDGQPYRMPERWEQTNPIVATMLFRIGEPARVGALNLGNLLMSWKPTYTALKPAQQAESSPEPKKPRRAKS